MDRRGFFRTGSRKLAETTINQVGKHVQNRAKHWIRPPYALDELEFLATCTRCGECIDACPHQVIFPLASRLGASVAGTPALDLVNKGCHLCTDWPCVTACEPGALTLPRKREDSARNKALPAPQIALAHINKQSCLAHLGPECGACASSCPIPEALVWNAEKPAIDPDYCTGCGLCREACIVDPKAIEIRSLYRENDKIPDRTRSATKAE
jgi:ferredoxin-type protein NapG